MQSKAPRTWALINARHRRPVHPSSTETFGFASSGPLGTGSPSLPASHPAPRAATNSAPRPEQNGNNRKTYPIPFRTDKTPNRSKIPLSPATCRPPKCKSFFCISNASSFRFSKKGKKCPSFKNFFLLFKMGKRETGEKIWSVTREERQDGEA